MPEDFLHRERLEVGCELIRLEQIEEKTLYLTVESFDPPTQTIECNLVELDTTRGLCDCLLQLKTQWGFEVIGDE